MKFTAEQLTLFEIEAALPLPISPNHKDINAMLMNFQHERWLWSLSKGGVR